MASRDFHHPYRPYDIQVEFMSALYDCLDDGKIGIFESPTGTGKSLSIICGALTWLRDRQYAELGGSVITEDEDEPAWVVKHAKAERIKRFLSTKGELESRLAKIRSNELGKKKRFERGEPLHKRIKRTDGAKAGAEIDEAAFALDDYELDSGDPGLEYPNKQIVSNETLALLEKAGMISEKATPDEDALNVSTKVFYCSRTHSQLAQFAHEVRRVSIPTYNETKDVVTVAENVKLLTLGARKNLCINSKVAKLGYATAINERCLELQQPKISADQKCPFVPSEENKPLVIDFRDHTLARIRDIEDLADLGKELGICPYYSSRATIKSSEIVTLPYPLLLQKSAREALNLSLKDQVIIIDEAHNLMNALESIYSVSVTLRQLQDSRNQLGIYLRKFRSKLKGKNRVYVTQVVRLIDSLVVYLTGKHSSRSKAGVVDVVDLMSGKGIDQLNLHDLCRYLQESKLARKVAGYVAYASAEHEKQVESYESQNPTTPTLMIVEGFFHALTNPAAEGQFFYEEDEAGMHLKYMLLDPAHHFRAIVDEARAVVLAGGTMSPMDDYISHLFPYLDPDRIRTLSCGHVIPKDNLLAFPVTTSAREVEFDFTFDKRNTSTQLKELGRTLLDLAQAIPDGVVVFFPSYAYLDQAVKHWSNTEAVPGTLTTVERIKQVKTLFQEHKGVNVDQILADYAAAIDTGQGALMFAVIGGKLSEGINFSDKLGRGVVVVGLPFPNIQSIEWKTKLNYIEQSAIAHGRSIAEGKAASREFYENACMRAVNQSVGRAIRHKEDFACIMLLDRRYATRRIQAKLPGWIRSGLVQKSCFDEVLNGIRDFFLQKQ